MSMIEVLLLFFSIFKVKILKIFKKKPFLSESTPTIFLRKAQKMAIDPKVHQVVYIQIAII